MPRNAKSRGTFVKSDVTSSENIISEFLNFNPDKRSYRSKLFVTWLFVFDKLFMIISFKKEARLYNTLFVDDTINLNGKFFL